MVPRPNIPGTLNVGHTLPTVVQALIYIAMIEVDVVTLVSMIAAAVAGAWLGAGVVAGWSRRTSRSGWAWRCCGRRDLVVMRNLGLLPAGANALGLTGTMLLADSPATSCSGR